MKLRNVALSAVGMMFLALTSFAQITTIEGDVKGADGQPVQKAEIKIIRTDIKGNYPTKTNKKGHYLYMGLPMGTYTVECYVDGKKVDSVGGVRTTPASTIENVVRFPTGTSTTPKPIIPVPGSIPRILISFSIKESIDLTNFAPAATLWQVLRAIPKRHSSARRQPGQ